MAVIHSEIEFGNFPWYFFEKKKYAWDWNVHQGGNGLDSTVWSIVYNDGNSYQVWIIPEALKNLLLEFKEVIRLDITLNRF